MTAPPAAHAPDRSVGAHVLLPGRRFWPHPSQEKMPKYAAASKSVAFPP